MSESTAWDESVAAAAATLGERLIELVRMMRDRGAAVGEGQVLAAHRALASIEPAVPEQAAMALQATLCAGHGDIAIFRVAFAAVFGSGQEDFTTEAPRPWNARPAVEGDDRVHGASGAAESDGGPVAATAPTPASGTVSVASDGVAAVGDGEVEIAAWSAFEALRRKDFRDYAGEDEAVAEARFRQLASSRPRRPSSRLVGAAPRGRHPATRRLLRDAVRHEGEVTELRWRRRSRRSRRLVLLCDVSASMRPYARHLLRYLHAVVLHGRDVEAFTFGTRLSRVTLELRRADWGSALTRVSDVALDAAAGTRIGVALEELNRRHRGRVGRGAVVVVLSDGWDRGRPLLLGRELSRLRLCSHRLIWLNPLSARPGFEPLTRGMREALPHLDQLAAGNSLAALELLALDLEEGRDREGNHRRARSLAGAR